MFVVAQKHEYKLIIHSAVNRYRLPSPLGDCVAMLQISADVMLSESEASAFSAACEKQILRLRLRMTF